MSKVVIRSAETAPAVAFPPVPYIANAGNVTATAIMAGADRPILLYRYDLGPDAEIQCRDPQRDHLFYIWQGAATVDGTTLGNGDVIIAEKRADFIAKAGTDGASILHFCPRTGRSAKPGGKLHVLRLGDQAVHYHPQSAMTLYADSTCPSCDVWFHIVEIPADLPVYVDQLHSHSEDEIIFVVDGTMVLGPRKFGAGTALAIDADTIYTFGVTKDVLRLVNFRAGPSSVSMVLADGQKSPPWNEREFITGLPTSPPDHWPGAASSR